MQLSLFLCLSLSLFLTFCTDVVNPQLVFGSTCATVLYKAFPLGNTSNTSAMPLKKDSPSKMKLSPFLRGVVYGMFLAGMSSYEIADEVVKTDGTHLTQQGARNIVQLAQKAGGFAWDGTSRKSGNIGRPRATSAALDKAVLKLVFKHRGRAIVTVAYIQKVIKAARKVSERTIARRLSEAGLAWLTRRRKSLVPEVHKASRVQWAAWVLTRTCVTLGRWAYSDGTTFYLARSSPENDHAQRGALGRFVWRQADGSDGLFEDCVGPSSYWKAQGTTIRIWGLLVAGIIYITILPEGAVMNRWWYEWIVEHRFKGWLDSALGEAAASAFLVQDHERALWTAEPRAAMRRIGLKLLENYPKCSQDLNPIETAWREVRSRLVATQPRRLETREAFLPRLRAAVAWVNRNRHEYLLGLCNRQKALAKAVIAAGGARTKY